MKPAKECSFFSNSEYSSNRSRGFSTLSRIILPIMFTMWSYRHGPFLLMRMLFSFCSKSMFVLL